MRAGPARRDKMAPTAETQPPIYLEINQLLAFCPPLASVFIKFVRTPFCLNERGPARVNKRVVTVISQPSDGPVADSFTPQT